MSATLCPVHKLSPSYAYKVKKCRCPTCKEVRRASNRPKTKTQKRIAAERTRQWRLDNLERSRLNAKNWQAQNPDKVLAAVLKRKYGLTLERYYSMLDQQDGVCAICQGGPEGTLIHGQKRLAVDHCHETGKVRALLCGECNTGLGKFRDSAELLGKAIEYLRTHSY